MTTTPTAQTTMRAMLAFAILCVLVFKSIVAAATPMPVALPFGVICSHDGASVPDAPADAHAGHDGLCCTAAQAGPAIVPPLSDSALLVWRSATSVAVARAVQTGRAPRPPPLAQVSPRGPPAPV